MTAETLPTAKALVRRVFPLQTPNERLSLLAFTRPDSRFVRIGLRLAGVSDPGDFWVAVDDGGTVIGTTGLYRYRKDAHDGVWLNWFCVAPGSRGAGVGGQLLDFTVEQARATGARFLRLYASDGSRWDAAKRLCESRGLRVCQTRNRVVCRLITRELELV